MFFVDKILRLINGRTITSPLNCSLAITCLLLMFKECRSECKQVKYLQSFTLPYSYPMSNSNLDFTLLTTDSKYLHIAEFHASVPTFGFCANGYVCANVSDHNVSITFTVQTFIDRIDVAVDKVNTTSFCFIVTAIPASFSCGGPYFSVVNGVNQASLNCNAPTAFPKLSDSTCSIYKLTQRTEPLLVVNTSFIEYNWTLSNEILTYTTLYNLVCTFVLTEMDYGMNQVFSSMQYMSTLLNSSTYSFNYTEFSWSPNKPVINIGDAVQLTCDTKLVRAQNFTISRRGGQQQSVLNSTTDTHSLQYTIDSFTCQHIDEYECIAFVGGGTGTTLRSLILLSPYNKLCAPQIVNANQQNRTFSVNPGDDLFIATDISSVNLRTLTFLLMFVEKGQIISARKDFYTVHSRNYSLYYATVNLALYGVDENDYRDYFLSVADDKFETQVYFKLSSGSSSNSYRDAVIGVSVLAGVLFLLVVALLAVILVWRCRHHDNTGRVNTRPPSPEQNAQESYDALERSKSYDYNYNDDGASPLHMAPRLPDNADEDGGKYELVTATNPPPAKKQKTHLPNVPAGTRRPPPARPEEETYEDPTLQRQAPSEIYGNDQPIYGNIQP